MNELKRNGKRTREQLTFSDTYLEFRNILTEKNNNIL